MKQNVQPSFTKNASLLKRLERFVPPITLKKQAVAKKIIIPKKHTFVCGSKLNSRKV